MKELSVKALREKNVKELNETLEKERAALYDTRRKLTFREIKDTNTVRQHRHNIARILTLIGEKEQDKK